ncbi:MAG: hypothetical protein MUF54_01755 [Polyangiaceae bacterium]|jgi:uncharacterized tellurite resistance protein B-like protein|nr:hypothetical protein [Polyangiaceae bacterium]
MDEYTRRKVCRLIAGIVVIDDELDEAEDKFVDRMLARFELSTEERDALFPIMDAAEAAQAFAALAPEVQSEAFDLLVQAAAVDGVYAPEERKYLVAVGKVIGVGEDDIAVRMQAAIGGD